MGSADDRPQSARAARSRRRSSLTTGLQVLECVSDKGSVRVSEIAASLGLPVSTTHRYLRQLRDEGYVYDVGGYYCLGDRWAPAVIGDATSHLIRAADPLLHQLTDLTGEAAMLNIRVSRTVRRLVHIMPRRQRTPVLQRSDVRPLYAGASARVLLAHAPPDVVAAVTAGVLHRFTSRTCTKQQLLERLDHIRQHGFDVSFGEVHVNMAGVAGPVLHDATCVCGLSIAGPSDRLNGKRLDRAVEAVVAANQELSKRTREVGA